MAKLVLSFQGSIVHQCFVDKDRVSIGTDAGNGMAIEDPAVEARHATVLPVGNDHILEDLQSGSGTLVNGSRVSRHILQHGDVVQIGSHFLRYLNPRAAAEVDLERTMLISGLPGFGDATALSGIDRLARSARRSNVRFPSARVRATAGQRSGQTIALDRVIATFGQHGEALAVIARRPQGYFLSHVEGRRRTRLNGHAVAGDAQMLQHGDRIEVGGEALEFLAD
jgi:pSer/pThr/pTyr-binding forkhead associated (FHA) protein